MSRPLSSVIATALLALSACVTINVYFPAAAAEKAADRIIDDVWKQQTTPPATPAPAPRSDLGTRLFIGALELLVAPAYAQQPDIDVSSPEVQRLKAQMEGRFASLKPLLDSGAVGLTGDGMVSLRDANAVPLAQRNAAKSVVAEENKDRKSLYEEIAKANNQPQWAGQIQSVFAQRWVAKAQAGWWYEDSAGWKQKK